MPPRMDVALSDRYGASDLEGVALRVLVLETDSNLVIDDGIDVDGDAIVNADGDSEIDWIVDGKANEEAVLE